MGENKLQEMAIVEVVVEKGRYDKEGVHKGMQGRICEGRGVNGYWLVKILH